MFLEEGVGEGFSIVFEVSKGLAVAVLGMGLKAEGEFSAEVGSLGIFYGYDGLGGGVVAEGGASGLDAWRELGFVEGLLGGRSVLLGNYVVDRLFHFLLSFIYNHLTTPRCYIFNRGAGGEREGREG